MELLCLPQHDGTNAGALMYIWLYLRLYMLADAAL